MVGGGLIFGVDLKLEVGCLASVDPVGCQLMFLGVLLVCALIIDVAGGLLCCLRWMT